MSVETELYLIFFLSIAALVVFIVLYARVTEKESALLKNNPLYYARTKVFWSFHIVPACLLLAPLVLGAYRAIEKLRVETVRLYSNGFRLTTLGVACGIETGIYARILIKYILHSSIVTEAKFPTMSRIVYIMPLVALAVETVLFLAFGIPGIIRGNLRLKCLKTLINTPNRKLSAVTASLGLGKEKTLELLRELVENGYLSPDTVIDPALDRIVCHGLGKK